MFDLRRSTLTSLNRLTSSCHLLIHILDEGGGFTVSKREEELLLSVNSSEHKSKLIEAYIIADKRRSLSCSIQFAVRAQADGDPKNGDLGNEWSR